MRRITTPRGGNSFAAYAPDYPRLAQIELIGLQKMTNLEPNFGLLIILSIFSKRTYDQFYTVNKLLWTPCFQIAR